MKYALLLLGGVGLGVFIGFVVLRQPTTSQPSTQVGENKEATQSAVPTQDVVVISPKQDSVVYSPLAIKGLAVGNWFFEGSFTVKVVDTKGKVLGSGVLEALSDAYTTKHVPFEGVATFVESENEAGSLIFEKSNPSGLPENKMEYSVPIRFK